MKEKVIDLGQVASQCVPDGTNHLVTRETGRSVRRQIEQEIAAEEGPALFVLDFSRIGIVDYSCADEIIVKLISRSLGDEYGDIFLLLSGLNRHQMENVEVALERKKLAAICINPSGEAGEPGEWRLIGILNKYLTETFESVMGKGSITARDMASNLGIALNTAGTRLLNLLKKRLIARTEESLLEGGRQFNYSSLVKRGK